MASETEARTRRSHPEAALAAEAGGSDSERVKIRVTNVYNSSISEVVNLETTNTVSDLKRLIQEGFDSRPAPHQQRLIFRGKQCEEAQQLGHILRGVNLSALQNMHLVVTQPIEQKSRSPASPASPVHPPTDPATASVADTQSPDSQPPRPPPTTDSDSLARGAPGASPRQPDRLHVNAAQKAQLEWQYQQALRESHNALLQHQRRYQFLSRQAVALAQLEARDSSARSQQPLPRQRQSHWRPSAALESEVAASEATRALGGNMPGPAAGAAVRDITGTPPPGYTPAAGVGQHGEGGHGNLADPPRRGPDVAGEARRWFKIMLQLVAVMVFFGLDADGWVLVLLAVGGVAALLYKTGFLEAVLGGGGDGGGTWQKLRTAATVISEGDGLLMDVRHVCCAFVFSLFPPWKPVRSPEAIAAEAVAAEAAARAARAAATEAEAATRRIADGAAQDPDATAGHIGAEEQG